MRQAGLGIHQEMLVLEGVEGGGSDAPAAPSLAALNHLACKQPVAAATSLACRVLANNDTPTGPGRIPLEVALPADWEG